MTALAWSVVSSRGSRRPLLDRQCAHSRLQAYVSSQVRQIGASRPNSNCSTSVPVRGRSAVIVTLLPPLEGGSCRSRPSREAPRRRHRAGRRVRRRVRAPSAHRAPRRAAAPRQPTQASSGTSASGCRSGRPEPRTAPVAAPPTATTPTALPAARPSVDAAHAVDRDLLDQVLRDQFILLLVLRVHRCLLRWDVVRCRRSPSCARDGRLAVGPSNVYP